MWYGDGTFKTVPRIAAQLYTLHYERTGHTFAAVYVVMENRTQEMYNRVFSKVRLKGGLFGSV